MSSMKLSASLFLISSLLVVACGGATPDAVVPGATTSLQDFKGSWTGSWSEDTVTHTKLQGTASLSVDEKGVVSGTMTNATLGMDGKVAGQVSQGGAYSGTFVYPKASLSGSGHVGVAAGKLTGAITVMQGQDTAGTLHFELTHAPAAP